jgi:hypothetical protein
MSVPILRPCGGVDTVQCPGRQFRACVVCETLRDDYVWSR